MVEFSKKSAPVSAGDSVDWDADTVGRDEWQLVILSASPPPLLLSPRHFFERGRLRNVSQKHAEKNSRWEGRGGDFSPGDSSPCCFKVPRPVPSPLLLKCNIVSYF